MAYEWNFKRIYPTRFYLCWIYINHQKYEAAAVVDDFGGLVITHYQ